MDRVPLLYDADCGFCRASLGLVLAWDRHRRLRPVALQSSEAESLLEGMERERMMTSWHLVLPGRRRVSGGAAAAPLLRLLPRGSLLAAAAERAPGAVEGAYRWVVNHRETLARPLPKRFRRRADALIRARS